MTILYTDTSQKAVMLSSLSQITETLSTAQIECLILHARKYSCITDQNYPTAMDISERERDVLTLLASGYTRKNIGTALGISANTAARHISNIYRKLDVSSIAEATQYAYQHNLLQVLPVVTSE